MQRGVLSVTRVLSLSLIVGRFPGRASCPSPSVHTRRCAVILNHICRLSSSHPNMSYSLVERGPPNSLDYRVFFKSPSGTIISPFHDIPLYANQESKELNMVVEIPRWSNAKMEISKEERLNPIKQDVKKGKLRYVKNIFPHHGYIWNYGALPQTWEDPDHTHPDTDAKGDKDPIDVCEIGHKIHKRGEVIQVKVLGTMCLIDEGETDWKIIAIDVTDPMAAELHDIDDVHKKMPGFLKATYEWFKYYKVPDGKPENTFAFDGEAKGKEYALKVIDETNAQWKKLISDSDKASTSGIACENTCVGGSPCTISGEEAQSLVNEIPAPAVALEIDPEVCVDKWYYPIP